MNLVLILKCTIYVLDYVMKNNNIIYNKWEMNLKHRYLSLRRDRQTKQYIVYPKCLHFIFTFHRKFV